jgi:hypothetical protein
MFSYLLINPSTFPLLSKKCVIPTTFLYVQSTPKNQTTCLLLQVFLDVAKTHTNVLGHDNEQGLLTFQMV